MTAAPTTVGALRVALLGNPNTGKTTLFNALTGLNHKTSNFPGTTQEARVGKVRARETGRWAEVIDLPGVYSLELNQVEAALCRAALDGSAAPAGDDLRPPDVAIVVADATNLARNLTLAGEVLRRGVPTVVAVNMIDLADRRGISIDAEKLSRRLSCDVALVCARTGSGLGALIEHAERAAAPGERPPEGEGALARWAEEAARECATVRSVEAARREDAWTDRVDRVLTHPVLGLAAFALVMTGLFWGVFRLASWPMDWIDGAFGSLATWVEGALPGGVLTDLLAGGVISGVGATVVFLPQICLLFFMISILEGTGYLARAAFVTDRWLRPFGLSGHAFVPLLSSHACALPGIMSCRGIPDRRERLAAILVAPFMSCSARIPVYVLLCTLLFRESPGKQAIAFAGCYVLGAAAGVVSALVARRTVAKGESAPMALELPSYKPPSVRTAFVTMYDKGLVFLKQAGTNILAITVALWWLSAYPKVEAPAEVTEMRARAASLVEAQPGAAEAMLEDADRIEHRYAARRSFVGRLGSVVEPVLAPLGYDRQLSIGVLASFAAREVFVSTMAVVTRGDGGDDEEGLVKSVAEARRDDGRLVFTERTCWSLLIYYVLAMQCLPTLVVTAKEAGGWKWALLQLAWMSGLAYVAALLVYQGLGMAGLA